MKRYIALISIMAVCLIVLTSCSAPLFPNQHQTPSTNRSSDNNALTPEPILEGFILNEESNQLILYLLDLNQEIRTNQDIDQLKQTLLSIKGSLSETDMKMLLMAGEKLRNGTLTNDELDQFIQDILNVSKETLSEIRFKIEAEKANLEAEKANLEAEKANLESALTGEEKKMMPEVDGLYRTKEGEEYVYKALEANEYGLEAGEHAGLYRENIYIQEFYIDNEDYLRYNEGDTRKSGGVCLIPSVVEKIAMEKEESLLVWKSYDLIPIPVDISFLDIKEEINILVDTTLQGIENTGKSKGSLKIELSKPFPIINICHGINSFTIVNDRGNYYILNDFLLGDWGSGVDDGDQLPPDKYANVTYFGSSSLGENNFAEKFTDLKYGDKIMEVNSDIYIANRITPGSSLVYSYIISLDSVDGKVPLFIMAND